MSEVAAGNRETMEAWEGPMFNRFLHHRGQVAAALGPYGEAAFAAFPPPAGVRALDLGCGFGETTRRLAELLGPEGEAVGVDISAPFVELARRESGEAGVANCDFRRADVQATAFEPGFGYAFSRMGLMFFDDPVAALGNVAAALAPGALLCAVVWRRKEDNLWVHCAEQAVLAHLERPAESAGPTYGPGPYSLADADLLTDHLLRAGFEEVTLRRCDIPIAIGADLDAAVEYSLSMGPAGALLREWGDRIEEVRPRIADEVRNALAPLDGPDGVVAPGSAWIVAARAGAAGQ